MHGMAPPGATVIPQLEVNAVELGTLTSQGLAGKGKGEQKRKGDEEVESKAAKKAKALKAVEANQVLLTKMSDSDDSNNK